VITTVAGSGATTGFEGYGRGTNCGDGGPATSACLNTPIGVAVRDDGTMFINAWFEIRKVSPAGTISSLRWPQTMKLVVGPGQAIFAHGLYRIYREEHDAVRTLTGGNADGFSGDGGPATAARMATGEVETAQGLAIDAEGNLFFHDAGNRRIRVIRYGAVLAPPNATVQATVISDSTIRATVFDSAGQPAPGVRVDFTAPSGGRSCHFPNRSNTTGVITDSNGVAVTSCVPNCAGNGSFVVTAQPLTASATATVTMFDTSGPCRRRAVRH
jgi:hypothetical protein